VPTFLIADVRGYTRFTLERGDEEAARLATRFADLCEETAGRHHGRVVELRGDEALAVFESARDALRASVALQAAFKEARETEPSLPLHVGIGLDAGDAVPVKGGFRGGALNLAARLCSIAGGGEILASEGVIHLARKTEGLVFIDRGQVSLKGLSTPVRVLQIAPEGAAPATLPPLQPILVTHPTNLPDDPTPFIGREREIAAIVSRLRDPHIRLVTLTGPGGTGKTRLALQVGSMLLYEFRDGVFFCDLAPLQDASLVPSAIAQALGISEQGGRSLTEALGDHLRERHLLLVLDNLEHLLDAAGLVAGLLDTCRELHVLVTSRIPLRIRREHEHAVPPLAVPDAGRLPDLESLSQYESVALFIERARAVKDSFTVTNENAPAVAEICARLDGLPLALELAAARIKLFPPQALLQRLDSRLTLLTGGARDLPERQRTLRGAIDWSYSLLNEEEQVLFARLSVFAGGWTFEAAEAVCGQDGAHDLLWGLASLVDKSLVRQEGDDDPRFSMLDTIREYAAEKLDEFGEGEQIRDVQADYFLVQAEEAKPFLDRRLGRTWLERLAAERDNVRVAFGRLLSRGRNEDAARMATALWGFWRSMPGSWIEGRQQLEAALDRPGLSERTRADALIRLCNALSHEGSVDRQESAAREVLAIGRRLGDPATEFHGTVALWVAAMERGDRDEAAALHISCLALAEQTTDVEISTHVLRMQGLAALESGDLDRARALFAEEIARRRDPAVGGDIHGALLNIGSVYLQLGDLDAAEAAYTESGSLPAREELAHLALARGQYDAALKQFAEILPEFRRTNARPGVALCLEGIAQGAMELGSPELGAVLFGAATSIFDSLGYTHELYAEEQKRIDRVRAAMGTTAWGSAYERGRALSLDDAADLALQWDPPSSTTLAAGSPSATDRRR
jgi:predicted ATPase/class 3 adenylate cyclase